ncbi:hypothetical protein P154DRAFT_243640 [Amniculicola lignicola CBS 123094]|uniref:Uncharacterized protein n=1 Tax=Amniculicola lignicola CBS 123094 TaxID=1392246 RepID=A0A6A5WD76_9PLEO|nr:hypothetical protein P154DRAFT_243640 [Amniculicola lignicola CBS 123094]
MCRIEERIYIKADGSRQKFEDVTPCDRAPGRQRLCSNVTRKITEYYPKNPPSRDDSASPASLNPPTPTGSGTYLVQERRPPTARRPSTSDGTRLINPALIIQVGSNRNRDRDGRKTYTKTTSKPLKRTSLTNSINSSDIAIDSPGSDISYPIRTGLPDTPVHPVDHLGTSPGYATRQAVPRGQGHRHSSSASSFTTNSQPPSLYATSDPESPGRRRAPRYPPTIVHNPPPGANNAYAPPSPTIRAVDQLSSSPYRTVFHAPRDSSSHENVGSVFDFLDPPVVTSSHGSSSRSGGPEVVDNRPRRTDADKRRQEAADAKLAEQLQKDENQRQVHFELGRAEARERERNENTWAEKEKRRAEDRENFRAHTQQEKDRAEKEAREKALRNEQARKEEARRDEIRREANRREEQRREEARKEEARRDDGRREGRSTEARPRERRESRPPTRDTTKRPSRRNSMTRAEMKEREHLLAETKAQMAREREAADQREREDEAALLRQEQENQAALLRQQQATTQYYNPRGGAAPGYPPATETPAAGLGRRTSVSGRRGSVSVPPQPPNMPLGRSNSRRVSVIQPTPPNLPSLNTAMPPPPPPQPQTQNPYSMRPPSAHTQQSAAPLFPPNSMGQTYAPPTYSQTTYTQPHPPNPFALPATRAPPQPQPTPLDAWDSRQLREAIPSQSVPPPPAPPANQAHARQPSDERSLRRRGEEVIERAAQQEKRDRVRTSTKKLTKVVGFESSYEEDDGFGRKGKRKS